ncbi:Fic family protein [Variovorax sp. VRV01]|uniref:Fic family protein n=1 Tax=Variovorax sp. VRV01 TaxID=2769259 RepID=UPI00177C8A61|nr:Fic family protein [Variovorax sp. VRV01]MBD9667082.1 Fic family protein [Variovorax sp. VRV01]
MIAAHAIQITPEVLKLIASIDEFKGAWRALGTLAPDRLLALRRVATIESIGSSTRIEGCKLSDLEVERLLFNRQNKSFSTRDEQEVAGYAEVMELVFSSWQYTTLTENYLKKLHRNLLAHSETDAWHRGSYKTLANNGVAFDKDGKQSGAAFETATPIHTPRLVTELVAWFNEERDAARFHPLLLIGTWVVTFLEIHPFQDGNGHLSRVLTTLLLLQAGYAYVPYSSLESVIEQSKEAYDLALRQTRKTIRTESPNWQPWLIFFLRALAEQVRRLNRKVEREKLVLATLPELSLQIVEFAREHGRITMGDAIRLTDGSRNTLKQHFRVLVERGHLAQHGAGRGVWYQFASSPDAPRSNHQEEQRGK